jgi:hypothetical protein
MAIITLGVPTIIIAVLAILLGILILLLPRILRWAVGLYLIVSGITALMGFLAK